MLFVRVGLTFLLLFAQTALFAANNAIFSCGGDVETAAWKLWDDQAKWFLQNELQSKLVQQGDTYILYDMQLYTHNLVGMAIRCKRWGRLAEYANLLATAYQYLEKEPEKIELISKIADFFDVPYYILERESDSIIMKAAEVLGISDETLEFGSDGVVVRIAKKLSFATLPTSSNLVWVCKGGSICNAKNKLLNREIVLNSAQFLGLTTDIANAFVSENINTEPEFVQNTALIAIQHMLNWSDAHAISEINKLIIASPNDVDNKYAGLFLHDRHLWMMAIYANLSGILLKNPNLISKSGINKGQIDQMALHFSKLLELFAARTSLHGIVNSSGSESKAADIDRGFWRFYPDNQYAGYEGLERPVKCIDGKEKSIKPEVFISSENVKHLDDTGWDFGHARRLVQFFEAISRNRVAINKVFNINASLPPSVDIMRAFANQVLFKLWNRDFVQPLFKNYWSGANGWYRVAYDNGTGSCVEGSPPYGLSIAFPTGGYISWGWLEPELQKLGERLYGLSISTSKNEQDFIEKYYSNLIHGNSVEPSMVYQLMFLPSLVESNAMKH